MKLTAPLVITIIALAFSGPAQALPIVNFAKMKTGDQATYIDNMVEGAAKILKDEGHPEQAKKLMDLFFDSSKNGGVNQFVMRLKSTDAENRKNAINPNNRKDKLQVEDAMERTLKDNDILIPAKQLMAINAHFAPAAPKISDLVPKQEDGPSMGH